jgi:ketosteroid isomerase-like protein
MDMPAVVTAYFDADRRNDADALSKTFSHDAVVEDEGSRHQGLAAICGWWAAVKNATHYVAEPVEATLNGNKALVRAKVSGEFPGSPVTLAYAFTLKNDKIARLEIQ